MSTTFRAAYWISEDKQRSVRLTTEAQQELAQAPLLAVAQQEAEATGLEIGDGEIIIGEWTE